MQQHISGGGDIIATASTTHDLVTEGTASTSITTTSSNPIGEIITPDPMNVTNTPATSVAAHVASTNHTTATATTSYYHHHNSRENDSSWQYMTRTIAHYERLEQIGLGTYGQVYRAICKDTGRIVAMKKMRSSSSSSASNNHAANAITKEMNTATTTTIHAPPVHQPTGMPLQLIREIKILKQLQHPNLLSMIEVVTSKGVEHLDHDDPIPISSSNAVSTTNPKNNKNASTTKKKSSKDDRGQDKNDRDETKRENDDVSQTNISEEQQHAISTYHQQRLERERFKGNLFLVLEYMTHDLTGLLDVAYEFSVVQIKCIMKQLLLALQYMHEHKYIHRDIKSSNILMDSYFRLKLADFGLARSLEPPLLEQVESYSSGTSSSIHSGNTSLDLTNKVITLWYRPPEILLGTVHYGCAVDVWSAGCILAELITGKPLATGKTELDQLTLVADLTGTPTNRDTWEYLLSLKKSRSTPSSICNLATEWSEGEPRKSKLRDKYGPNNKKHRPIPEAAMALLEKVLEWDPRMRITAGNALQHRYFRSPPLAPDDPAELGRINVAEEGHFHEFITKQKRKQAKQLAEQSREVALRNGASSSIANEKYDEIYLGIMKQVAQEGITMESTKPAVEEVVTEVPEPKKSAVDDDDKQRGSGARKTDSSSANVSRRDRKHSRGGESLDDTQDDDDEYYDKDDPDRHDSRRRRQKKKRSSDKSDDRSSSRSHHHDKRRYSEDSEYHSDKVKRRSRKDSYDNADAEPTGNDSKYGERESSRRNQDIVDSSDKDKKSSKKHSRRDSDSGRSKKDRYGHRSHRDSAKKSNDVLEDNIDRRGVDDRYQRRVFGDRESDRRDTDRYRRPTDNVGSGIPPSAMGNRNEFERPYDNGPPPRVGDAGGRRRPDYDDPPPRTGGSSYGDFRPYDRRDKPSAGPVYGDYRPKDRRGDVSHHNHPHDPQLPPPPIPPARNRERDGPSSNHYNGPPNRDFGDRFQAPAPHPRRDMGTGPYPHGRDGPGRGGSDYGPRDSRPPYDDYPRRDRDGPRGEYGSAPPHPPPGQAPRRDGPVYGNDQFYRRDGGGGRGGRQPDSSNSRHPRDRNR